MANELQVKNGIASQGSARSGTSVTVGVGSHAEGDNTTSIGLYSHAEGWQSTASGSYSHSEGYRGRAIGFGAHAEGSHTTATGAYSHTEGVNTTALGNYSHASGDYAVTRHTYEKAYSVSPHGQCSRFNLYNESIDASYTTLYITGTEEFIVPLNSTVYVTAHVVGRTSDASASEYWAAELTAVANVGNSYASAVVNPNYTVIYDGTGTAWGLVTATISTSTGKLSIRVQGSSIYNVKWYADVEATMVYYP